MADEKSSVDEINAAVDRWFGGRIATAAIARDTEAYNQALNAVPDLKARLVVLFSTTNGDKAAVPEASTQE